MATIRVRMKSLKWYEVDGEMVGETIALTPALNDKLEYTKRWNVTHTPTGGTLGEKQHKSTALAIANALIKLGFDSVRDSDVNLAVQKLKAKGDINGFLISVLGRPPEVVAQRARNFAKARDAAPPPRATPIKPERRPKPARTSKPKTKAKAAPDLLALARAARRGAL